ncbi:ABC transporter ATP-binding protein [Arenibaculum pallidiluteum]|uniref:ABC transporter ATP-binding protein n=1 Tax=Arenibaculum pallidiluteum TaxID=2812559 RepID=UPI001A95A18E|nr:ABC transporter ATP-binding protein [Arenibaculum pallidiluteum]
MTSSTFDDGRNHPGHGLRERAGRWLRSRSVRRHGLAAEAAQPRPIHAPPPVALDALGPLPRSAATPAEALALERVFHRYGGVEAVGGVSLSVAAGEILCLVGPSGCGKSTLLRLAAGLERVQRGVVRIGGRVVADEAGSLAPERRGVGLVFQDYALFPHLTVIENVRFGLTGLPAARQQQRAVEALRQVGMEGHADVYPHALSGGQQQRVALARALAPNPAVLLLDEPFSGLDARLREQVRDETLHVLKRNGAATLLVTHDPEEAMFLADRIALMNRGRLVQVGTPVELYTRPAEAFAARFFGEVNEIAGTVRDGRVATPVGAVPARHLGDGEAARIMIRPEALRLGAVEPGAAMPVLARVEAARLLGRTSLVHLSVPDGRGGTLHLHSRMPGQYLPAEGTHVAVALDPAQAFAFPMASPI